MKIFVDTANLEEIKAALDAGFVDGVTTNPSLLAKEPKTKFEEHIGKIVDLLKGYKEAGVYGPGAYKHLSVEVFSKDPEKILEQAREFQSLFKYEALSVKIQIGWPELAVIRRLRNVGVSVNCTACMTVSQAVWAAQAGAEYASLFWGRIKDAEPRLTYKKANSLDKDSEGYKLLMNHHQEATRLVNEKIASPDDFDPVSVMRRTREIFEREKFRCEIIAGSMRTIWDVRDALLAGAHIVTVPYKFFPEFPKMVQHFKTDEVVDQFLKDFAGWMS